MNVDEAIGREVWKRLSEEVRGGKEWQFGIFARSHTTLTFPLSLSSLKRGHSQNKNKKNKTLSPSTLAHYGWYLVGAREI